VSARRNDPCTGEKNFHVVKPLCRTAVACTFRQPGPIWAAAWRYPPMPLMHALLKAVPDQAALLIVGDVDQLPSVGPAKSWPT
jgi:hypothetical protein